MSVCAATGCTRSIPRTMLMCRTHWRKVPVGLQRRIWNAYRHGPISEYVHAVDEAVAAVEARETPSYEREQLRLEAFDEHGDPHDPVVMEPDE